MGWDSVPKKECHLREFGVRCVQRQVQNLSQFLCIKGKEKEDSETAGNQYVAKIQLHFKCIGIVNIYRVLTTFYFVFK